MNQHTSPTALHIGSGSGVQKWTPRRRRFLLLSVVLLAAGVALALVLRAFSDNLVFFLTPTQVAAGEAAGRTSVRVGGMVQAGSIRRESGSLQVHFVLTDYAHSVPVTYEGVLPDLFVEGKGAVAQGRLDAQGHLKASEVLAKHDENYNAPGIETHPGKQSPGAAMQKAGLSFAALPAEAVISPARSAAN